MNFAELSIAHEGATESSEERSPEEEEKKEETAAATAVEKVHVKQLGFISEFCQQLQTEFWIINQFFRYSDLKPIIVEVVARFLRQINDQVRSVDFEEEG